MATVSKKDFMPDYSQYPWKQINSFTQVFQDSPVLIVLEFSTFALFLTALVHAIQHRRLSALLSAAVAGAANEVAFTNIPQVNNFWHAQSWLMITPRLPAWQPALYGFFLYASSTSADRLRLAGWNAIGRASVAGLLGLLILFPMDAVCVKFVAYTWHDTDPLLIDRMMGVAAGNGMFAAVYSGCFAALYSATGPLGAVLLSTPLMVAITLPIVQYVGQGVPTRECLVAVVIGLATLVAIGAARSRRKQLEQKKQPYWSLTYTVAVYFAVLFAVSLLADPAAQKSIGFHQPVSLPIGDPCRDEEDMSAIGYPRRVFLCTSGLGLSWGESNPLCEPTLTLDQHWYAVCGRPFGIDGSWGRQRFVAAIAGLAVLGLAGVAGCQ